MHPIEAGQWEGARAVAEVGMLLSGATMERYLSNQFHRFAYPCSILMEFYLNLPILLKLTFFMEFHLLLMEFRLTLTVLFIFSKQHTFFKGLQE